MGRPPKKPGNPGAPKKEVRAEPYVHREAESPLRPDVGVQAQFRKKKPPATYRYDSSLSPALDWDGQNPAREQGEWLIAMIEKASRLPPPHTFEKPETFTSGDGRVQASVAGLQDALDQLKRLSRPFLDWAGKAERLSFEVPTLPLFVHERLSTKAIVETLKSHRKEATAPQLTMFDMFGDPQRPVADQILKPYEHGKWVNRLILGDALVVMNSLLHYEGLGGQVQTVYIDPPYGVKFGSNFQPFVRKRDVDHNDDTDMTREPEMVKAYRDTWELGLHSYLTYLRDRLLLARDLLHPSGSVFVQISDENVHHVRELMDEVFGSDNFISLIGAVKTSGLGVSDGLASACDYLLWYARDSERVKRRTLFTPRESVGEAANVYSSIELPDGTRRSLTRDERDGFVPIPEGGRKYRIDNLTKPGPGSRFEFEFEGAVYDPSNRWWGTTPEGMQRLATANRLQAAGRNLYYVRYWEDFPWRPLSNLWADTATGGFVEEKYYVVQTNSKIIERCVLLTTDPGDLVVDPTCGSGTTAFVAEKWGRRWITIDTSRVPLALARQRLLTATFPYYQLKDEARGPAGGFVYVRKQNRKGEEVGGIVPHITLKSIANNEPPAEEVLVDRPEEDNKIVRVSGPFCVEATIPTPMDWESDGAGEPGEAPGEHVSFVERMLEVLRKSPVLQVGGGRTVTLKSIRPPAKTLSLSAEALVEATAEGQKPTLTDAVAAADEKNKGALPLSQKPVALAFGPENGSVSEKLVFEAAREAHGKGYTHLYVIGFAIQPNARNLIESCEAAVGVPATYVQATPDLMMGDLLKTMRSSQIFSVCGMPEIAIAKIAPEKAGEPTRYRVSLLGFDVFDPVTMETDHRQGDDVPAWFLDADYNNMVFHVSQAFFPRTGAWDSLKKALKASHDESVWEHLAGTTSAPFEAGEHGQIAVKVIDDRGNELLVVKSLKEAEA